MSQFQNKITQINVELGFIIINKANLIHFPKGNDSVKITCIFENENEPVQLTYNPKLNRIFGLTGWFRQHNAQAGDFINFEVKEPFKIYKLSFEKGASLPTKTFQTRSTKKGRDIFMFGEPINFRGIIFAPVNEQGVIFLFSKVHEDLGIKIAGIQQSYPDARGMRFNGRGWVEERIEFEYKASDFQTHGHDIEKCDIIVCWINDWQNCPIEIMELKSIIKEISE
ncbi:hypothetical protein AUJ27_01435 [Candidatus Falkowbacteria bacterium CG1_02_37_44]|uniref:Uncharacterized protein n=1 Tax=Candidatus Falkowbacteria bacterium CG1_02_37_44 TaxID=1805146 RepID=A0A1J4TC10_9BACT|nr:MAG: hypothetical protein AUJ27_01435 [Candidatus Falkowbacteria bacterium CG1_02_37_44]